MGVLDIRGRIGDSRRRDRPSNRRNALRPTSRKAGHEHQPAAEGQQAPAPKSSHAVLGLQRTIGNQATTRLIQRNVFDDAWRFFREGTYMSFYGGPDLAALALMAGVDAQNYQREAIPYNEHLGPGDALRHCTLAALVTFWGCLISPPLVGDRVSTGRTRAYEVLMGHEYGGGADAADSFMDQANNDVGMDIGEDVFDYAMQGQPYPVASYPEVRRIVRQHVRAALDSGRLSMFDATGALVSTSGWAALPEDTWANVVPHFP